MTPNKNANPVVADALVAEEGLFRFAGLRRFPHLLHAITRRHAPALCGEQEFNFSVSAGDSPEHALRCRLALAKAMGIAPDGMVWFDPAEPGDVRWVTAKERGKGVADWDSRLRCTSGLAAQSTNLFLCTPANDNTVVILFDPRWYAIALVSLDPSRPSGAPIEQAVELLVEQGKAEQDEIIGFIASGVGPCCSSFTGDEEGDTRGQTNIWDLARTTMLQSGFRGKNVFNSRTCTACRDTEFFSRLVDGPSAGAGAVVFGVRDDGSFGRMLAARKANASARGHRARKIPSAETPGLLLEERRLNAAMRCPHGENKVYVRSLLDGRSDRTTKPEIMLRCAVIQHVGQALGGHNIVDKRYIEKYCCGDYEACRAYQEFVRRRRD